jgi:hypothetical protein
MARPTAGLQRRYQLLCRTVRGSRIRIRFQSGQNHIAGTHPNPLAGTDILGYREPYAALSLLSHV